MLLIVGLVYVFIGLKDLQTIRLARLRGDPPPATLASAALDAPATDAETDVPLVNPFEVAAEQERVRAEELASTQRRFTEVLSRLEETNKRLVAALESANRTNQTTPVGSLPAAQFQNSTSAPQRPPTPLPAVSIDVGPATGTACNEFGKTSGNLSTDETQFLKLIPDLKQQYQDVVRRLIAAANGLINNPQSQSNVVNALNNWSADAENRVNGAFGSVALLDFRNTTPSDAPWKALEREKFSEAGQTAVSRATAYLSCLTAIEANLRAR